MSKVPSSISTLSTAYAPLYWYVNGQSIVQGTLAQLVTYLEANMTIGKADFTKQYSTPATGATVNITAGSANYWLILTPAATLATLTVKMPAVANLIDNQEVLVFSTQIITALTVDKNDATNIFGEPTSIAVAEGCFKMKYVAFTDSWYRISEE